MHSSEYHASTIPPGIARMNPSADDLRLRDRHNELPSPLPRKRQLIDDFALEVPRQDQNVIRLGRVDPLRLVDRNMRTWQKTTLLMRVSVDRILDEIAADP